MSDTEPLAAQIQAAERRLLDRRCQAGLRAAALAQAIHRQMTRPASLLLAGGVGFALGELTRRPPPSVRGPADPPSRAAGVAPWKATLNLVTTAHTLYAALPLAWRVRLFSGASHVKPAEQNPSPEPGADVRLPSVGV